MQPATDIAAKSNVTIGVVFRGANNPKLMNSSASQKTTTIKNTAETDVPFWASNSSRVFPISIKLPIRRPIQGALSARVRLQLLQLVKHFSHRRCRKPSCSLRVFLRPKLIDRLSDGDL